MPELHFIFLIVPSYMSLGKVYATTSPAANVGNSCLKWCLGNGNKNDFQVLNASCAFLIRTIKIQFRMEATFCSEVLKLFLGKNETPFLCLCDLGSTLITVFEQVGNIPSLMYDEDFAVHICHRHRHYPQLHIRNAR